MKTIRNSVRFMRSRTGFFFHNRKRNQGAAQFANQVTLSECASHVNPLLNRAFRIIIIIIIGQRMNRFLILIFLSHAQLINHYDFHFFLLRVSST